MLVGARSALFAPFDRIGVIAVDENEIPHGRLCQKLGKRRPSWVELKEPRGRAQLRVVQPPQPARWTAVARLLRRSLPQRHARSFREMCHGACVLPRNLQIFVLY